jgi:hypothetical protein
MIFYDIEIQVFEWWNIKTDGCYVVQVDIQKTLHVTSSIFFSMTIVNYLLN